MLQALTNHKSKHVAQMFLGLVAVSNHLACRCVERSVMGLLCKGGVGGRGGAVGDKGLFDGAAV